MERIQTEIKITANGFSVYSITQVANILEIPRYYVKNWIQRTNLIPIHYEGNRGYYDGYLLMMKLKLILDEEISKNQKTINYYE